MTKTDIPGIELEILGYQNIADPFLVRRLPDYKNSDKLYEVVG